jgi:hypothetical protein
MQLRQQLEMLQRQRFVADEAKKAAPRVVLLRALLDEIEIDRILTMATQHLPHIKYDDGHEISYLHTVTQQPAIASILHKCTSHLRAQPLLNAVGRDSALLNVRCQELHTYGIGSGLSVANHRDSGSTLTMSVLLSDCALVGGVFIIWKESSIGSGAWNVPVEHPLARGDAILFHSEDFHNVSPIQEGSRQSLVIELWTGATNHLNRET